MSHEESLIGKYRQQGIVVDTNLLILLFVGSVRPNLISKFGGVNNKGLGEKELRFLERLLGRNPKLLTTPHILTETSNFVCGLANPARKEILEFISRHTQSFSEHFCESKALMKDGAFFSFGLTDAAILDLPPGKQLVLSVDAPLVNALNKRGIDAINFNHLLTHCWQE